MATVISRTQVRGLGLRAPLFVLTILTGSFLLFLVQPMIARMALPRLGGAPAVWNSAMLVYQTLLLAGYAYAHALTRLAPRRQAAVHLGVFAVAALWLPLGLAAATPPADANPALWTPWLLALSIGPLFFAVAAQAPLMQHWFGLAGEESNPYALYAASNLGSFGGLIAYPLLVEPTLALAAQSMLWTVGYGLLFALVASCAFALPRHAPATVRNEAAVEGPGWRHYALWVALAAVPSGLMLSTTTHLTTDIVAMPLLWVLPLGLYLLSFSVAFAGDRRLADSVVRIAPIALLVLGGFTVAGGEARMLLLSAACALALLFIVAVALHTRMYRERPATAHLTRFYLAMSVGGALGGLFAALVAPLAFDWVYEHPILIAAAALLLPQVAPWSTGTLAGRWTLIALLAGLLLALVGARLVGLDANALLVLMSTALVLLGVAAIGRRPLFVGALIGILMLNGLMAQLALTARGEARTRSYFGVYTVVDNPEARLRRISHGTTVHGLQSLAPGRERELTSYYVPRSGVGEGLAALRRLKPTGARVGVVGLGAGTLACYRQPGDRWSFFEIDPAVVGIARDPRRFSFLSRCTPDAAIVVGDARLTLAAAPRASLDFIALDAFSSDAVPMHLLTREAFAAYARALGPDGLLLVHISNRHLDLEPVLAAIAARDGWRAMALSYEPKRDAKALPHASASLWIALARSEAASAALRADPAVPWRPLVARPGFTAWSDDHASILPLIKGWTAPARPGN